MNKQDRMQCEALSLAKSRYRINADEHFTAMELDNFLPIDMDTSLGKVEQACNNAVETGFLEVWGTKHGKTAYKVKESILMDSIAQSIY